MSMTVRVLINMRREVQTDHKPLENIFRKPLLSSPKRLQRMLLHLQLVQPKDSVQAGEGTRYRKYTQLSEVHRVIRSVERNTPLAVEQEEYFIKTLEEIDKAEFLPITTNGLADLREKTERDESLQNLKHVIRVGWPDTKEEVSPEIRKYFHMVFFSKRIVR